MATNFIQPGDSIEYSNSGSAIASGAMVPVGNRIGIAVTDIAATTGTGTVSLEGVYSVSKDGDEAFAVGDALFYDASDATVTKTATGNTWAGYAFAVAASDATSCHLKLSPYSKQAAIVAYSAGTNLAAAAVTATVLTNLSTSDTYSDAAVNAIFDEVQTALDLKADNADLETMRGSIETRLDAIDTGIAALITAMKNSGQMANS